MIGRIMPKKTTSRTSRFVFSEMLRRARRRFVAVKFHIVKARRQWKTVLVKLAKFSGHSCTLAPRSIGPF